MDPLTRDRVLRLAGIELRHLPGKHNQLDHGRRGPKALAKAAAKKALKTARSFDDRWDSAAKGRDASESPTLTASFDHISSWLDLVPSGVMDKRHSPLWAFGSYQGPSHETINDYLRYGHSGTVVGLGLLQAGGVDDESVTHTVAMMDAGMRASPLRQDTQLWRGLDAESLFGPLGEDSLVGFTWKDPGYTSTSVGFSTARRAATFEGIDDFGPKNKHPVILRILGPVGTSAVRLLVQGYEDEIVLGRGTTFRIVADSGVPYRSTGKIRTLDVEIVNQDEV